MNQHADSVPTFDGALGETTKTTVPVSKDSGGTFRAEVYTTVNVTEDPELREELFDGTLNEVEEPEGSGTHRPAVPVRYHDEEHRVFALVVPETLRHREFELRSELLEELSDSESEIPDYVSRFAVVFNPEELEKLEPTGTGSRPKIASVPKSEGLADASSEVEVDEQGDGGGGGERERDELEVARQELESDREELEQEREALESEWEELEKEREELESEWEELEQEREAFEEKRREVETKEEQLDEVKDRIDREREQMDEVEDELAAEREELEEMRRELEERAEELEAERQELEGEKLNLEDQRRRMEQEAESEPEENTQVVTDDQLVEVSSAEEVEAEDSDLQVEEVGAQSTSPQWDETDDERARPDHLEVVAADAPLAPESFDETEGEGVRARDGRIVVFSQLDDERLDALAESPPTFFVQYHDVDDFPLAALCFAALDDEGDVEASWGWPLDLREDDDCAIIDRFAEATDLEVAFYDEAGGLEEVFEVRAPYESNVEWIRDRVDEVLDVRDDLGSFDEAAETYRSSDFARVGTMQHAFDRPAFQELDTASQVELAAGVVGYWSTDEMFEYLVAHRTYPLEKFRQLQRDVVEEAIETGIFLEEPLREVAVDEGYADDERDLVERLLANFAEVGVQLKDNDLGPIEEWENWEALIDFAQEVGVDPDPDVVELAEASLKRARDFQETREVEEAAETAPDEETQVDEQTAEDFVEDPGAVDVDDLVVSKRSESTGVTYFLPDDAVIDTFDDLAEVPREDLVKLLDDPNERLEVAQMLIERFDGSAVQEVLEAAEEMAAPEVTALARYLESKADALEPELVRAVESAGPSATFVATRALAEIGSTSALPTLLDAYRADDRETNRRGMARALASYGDKLVAPLARSIQQEGADDDVTLLIQCLEEESGSAVEELADHRDDTVSEAVDSARDRTL